MIRRRSTFLYTVQCQLAIELVCEITKIPRFIFRTSSMHRCFVLPRTVKTWHKMTSTVFCFLFFSLLDKHIFYRYSTLALADR